jgi:hypothetical protein
MARHALALEDVRRTLVLAGRARDAVRDRVAVGGVLTAEVVALDDAGEALADGHALHVDALADLEDLDADLGAGLEIRKLFHLGAEFLQNVAGFDARLRQMAGERLHHAARAALAERDLNGGVAVLLGSLDLRDAVVGHVEHRHRQRHAVIGEDPRHADLAADQSNRHTSLFCLPGSSVR